MIRRPGAFLTLHGFLRFAMVRVRVAPVECRVPCAVCRVCPVADGAGVVAVLCFASRLIFSSALKLKLKFFVDFLRCSVAITLKKSICSYQLNI